MPAAESPLPGFFAWVQQQRENGLLDFEVKGEAEAEWETLAEVNAPPAPIYPTAAEEAVACEQATA